MPCCRSRHRRELVVRTCVLALWAQPELVGHTVVVIGGSSGIELETARRTRTEGASVVLTGQDPARRKRAGDEVDALSTGATHDIDGGEQVVSGA